MKIKEFVELYKNSKVQNTKVNPNAVEDFVRSKLEVKDYLPFVEKRALCEAVLEASCVKNGAIVEVDSVSHQILFTITILTKYTNLEFKNTDGEDAIDQYDMLCQNDLLNPILGLVAVEYERCNDILNMMMGDIDANNNNVIAVFNKALQKALDLADGIAISLKNKVDELNLDLSQINIDKYKGLLDLLPKK